MLEQGHGIGILLLSLPGTGKTLTAVSIAEHFRRPLPSFTPTALNIAELSLRDVFHLGHRWRAVLLLDEADPFIRKRIGSPGDERVTNLLKEFESFRGVLFLATNSIAHNIDSALYNRILQVIKYKRPTQQQLKQMWTLYIQTAGISFTSSDIDALARHDLVGREIQTIVRAAVLRSKGESKEVDIQTLENEMRKRSEFFSPSPYMYS